MGRSLEQGLVEILALPRGDQAAAIEALLAGLAPVVVEEAWNTAFGPGSLFEAWTRTTVASGVYAANAATLRPRLKHGFVVVEAGAGNGELWRRLLRPDDRGTLVAIDPSAQALEALAAALPPGVSLDARVGRVEDRLPLPEADAVVCSLTLHHLAGRDAAERARHGLEGPGKREVLAAMRDAVAGRGGVVVLSEADIHCEVDLASGSEVLRERLIDSYVRRCARSLLDDLHTGPPELHDRWRHIARAWCLEQPRLAAVPVAQRDVYELDVGRWLEVLAAAGLRVDVARPTDRYGLFWQYVAFADAG